MKSRLILSFFASTMGLLLFTMSAQTVLAVEEFSFPLCSNPQGVVKVTYPEGVHAIVGDRSTYNGSDTVYDLGKGNFMQCFCAVDNSGIQTNWLKLTDISDSEIDSFVKLGWIFVPDGSIWGLNRGAYLAKNSPLSCGSTHVTPTPTIVPPSSGGVGGGVITETAASTTSDPVLGLADSGTLKDIVSLGLAGFSFILLGRRLKAY